MVAMSARPVPVTAAGDRSNRSGSVVAAAATVRLSRSTNRVPRPSPDPESTAASTAAGGAAHRPPAPGRSSDHSNDATDSKLSDRARATASRPRYHSRRPSMRVTAVAMPRSKPGGCPPPRPPARASISAASNQLVRSPATRWLRTIPRLT